MIATFRAGVRVSLEIRIGRVEGRIEMENVKASPLLFFRSGRGWQGVLAFGHNTIQ